MATNTHASQAGWNAALNALLALLNGGFVEIYTGTQPATPDTLSGNSAMVTIVATAPGIWQCKWSASGGPAGRQGVARQNFAVNPAPF